MKKLSLDEIKAMSADEVVDGLRKRKFSLLQSMGFRKLRAEMNLTGFACWAIIALTGLRKEVKPEPHPMNLESKGRKRVLKILRKAAPCSVKGYLPHNECGTALGFNHPSLGEILRFIYICVSEYRDKINLFPVNLPWYEAIMPIVNELEEIGIFIMPVITPSTRRKMAKKADANTMAVVDDLSVALNTLYLRRCVDFIKFNNNVWVAPTATRQRTVFKTVGCSSGIIAIEPQTMTLLTISLMRGRVKECKFQVVGVAPPEDFGRGLNLFKPYKMGVGDSISLSAAWEEARKTLDFGGSEFELDFLSRIARIVKALGRPDLIAPEAAEEPQI
jgi:hypothetical protein